jgi:hypothetical protein
MATVHSDIPSGAAPITSDERKAMLRALDERPEPKIDYSDIPEATDISEWMTVGELDAYLAAERKQATPV